VKGERCGGENHWRGESSEREKEETEMYFFRIYGKRGGLRKRAADSRQLGAGQNRSTNFLGEGRGTGQIGYRGEKER